MATLTILRGISGSGKSTWARNQASVVVSRDAIRDMLFDQHKSDPAAYYAQPKDTVRFCESIVTTVQNSTIAGLLREGENVIVDNTNTQFKYVKALAKIGYRYGADVVVKVFDVPVAEACRRDDIRFAAGGRSVGHAVISKQYESFKANKNMTLDPVFVPAPYHGTPGKPKAFMVDIDGTLADMADKRGPYDLNVGVDDPRQKVIDVVNSLSFVMDSTYGNYTYDVIVMSGRKEDCREATEEWLDVYGVAYDHLFMRKSDDNRADNLIKADLFDEFVRDNFDVQFVIDDRPQVCDMWRRLGLEVFQVGDPSNDF